MGWTYDATDISSDLAKVRLLIGDTDTNDQQFDDAEVNFFINQAGNVWGAAAQACEALASNYARRVDKAVGRTRLSASQRVKHYLDLAKKLKAQGTRLAIPKAGGISIAEKQTQRDDSDRVGPSFHVGQFDNAKPARDETDWNATT
jgi:hypothetical protein